MVNEKEGTGLCVCDPQGSLSELGGLTGYNRSDIAR